jgi:hypothetical protein
MMSSGKKFNWTVRVIVACIALAGICSGAALAGESITSIYPPTQGMVTVPPVFVTSFVTCGDKSNTTCAYFVGGMDAADTWNCAYDVPGYAMYCVPAGDRGASPYSGHGR